MRSSNNAFEMSILVNEKPITEYLHEGNYFVEGRKGSDFSLYFKNNTVNRVLAVPSVDGLSIFDGQPATPESKGYLVSGFGVLVIPGWTLDQSNVAKFVFQDKEKSYASSTAHGASRAGVIGIMVFDEVKEPQPLPQAHSFQPLNAQQEWENLRRVTVNDVLTNQVWIDKTVYSSNPVVNICASPQVGGMVMGSPITSSATASASVSAQTSTMMDMGTGFGGKESFNTTQVKFNKGAVNSTLSIYYDSAKNLTRRGIQLIKQVRYDNSLPQAFSNVGCTPPPGWQK